MKEILKVLNEKHSGFLKSIFSLSFMLFLTNNITYAQNDLDVIRNNWLQFSDAQNTLYHHMTSESFRLLDSRAEKISKITTPEECQKRQSQIRDAMWNVIGSFPEKTPLNAKITGKVKKNGYRVENVIYESLPGFYVTASLFIPDKVKKPAPAILFCSGHSTGVYRLPSYQLPLLNLVKKGFIVLAIDPIGQGERLQYFNPETGESVIGSSTKEHSYPSAQVSLIGKSIARYFIWDGIRGIDYLISRKEVDPKRIGVHGLSGGGTQTAYISALDERVAASAPAGYITSYKRLMESIGVQDGEQNFYHGIYDGIDHADFIEIRAPKPTLIMATTRDFFSIQGSRETFKEVKKIYEIFGKPDNIEITEDDFGHGYTKKNREAMYAFFQKHFMLPGSSAEEEVDFPTAQELQKTSTGQLSTSLGGESVFSLNQKEAGKMLKELQASRSDLAKHLPKVIISAKKLSGYIEPSLTDEPVFTGRIQKNNYVVEKYFVKGEGNYVIPYLLFIPAGTNNKAVVYLHPSGKTAEAAEGGQIEWFVNKGFTVLAPDLIGIGELGPGIFKGDAFIENTSYNMWYTAMQIGRSIVGVQAADVVKLTHILLKNNEMNEVYGIAIKDMSPLLLHAAAFDHVITRVALVEPYSSYSSIVMNRFYKTGFVHSLVPGALTAYDLPDLAASLAPRKLMIAGMTDGNGKTADTENINNDLDIIKNAFLYNNANSQLSVLSKDSSCTTNDLYLEWIK
ncbi:MAG: alpha/beta hydrolase family protein [Bacteroidales bacterium]|nr:alpha/beta hydrolase family protein [Bacteroidales bacterium]